MADFKTKKSREEKNNGKAIVWKHILAVVTVIMFIGLVSGCQVLKTTVNSKAYNPKITSADFNINIDNPYFTLTPGTTFITKAKLVMMSRLIRLL